MSRTRPSSELRQFHPIPRRIFLQQALSIAVAAATAGALLPGRVASAATTTNTLKFNPAPNFNISETQQESMTRLLKLVKQRCGPYYLPDMNRYAHWVDYICQGHPPEMWQVLAFVASQESRWDHTAKGKWIQDGRGIWRRPVGLMQFIPSTFEQVTYPWHAIGTAHAQMRAFILMVIYGRINEFEPFITVNQNTPDLTPDLQNYAQSFHLNQKYTNRQAPYTDIANQVQAQFGTRYYHPSIIKNNDALYWLDMLCQGLSKQMWRLIGFLGAQQSQWGQDIPSNSDKVGLMQLTEAQIKATTYAYVPDVAHPSFQIYAVKKLISNGEIETFSCFYDPDLSITPALTPALMEYALGFKAESRPKTDIKRHNHPSLPPINKSPRSQINRGETP